MALNPVSSKLKKLAWGAGIVFILVLGAHFLLPLVVNTSELRLRILSQVSERVGGEVDFQALTVVLLPMPHAVVTQGRIEQSGKFRMRFTKGVVYPRFLSLLRGRVKISRLAIIEPDIVIPVATERPFFRQRSQGYAMKEMGKRIHRVLINAADAMGPLTVRIEGGRLTITRSPHPNMIFTEMQFEGRVSDKELAVSASGRSNLMESCKIAGHIALDSLDGSARIQLTGLDTPRLVSLGLIPPDVPMTAIGADLTLGLDIRGFENIRCKYQVETSWLTISNGTRRLNVRDLRLHGEGRRTPEKLWLSLARMQAAEPEVQLSATASWPDADRHSWVPAEVTLKGTDLDVTPIRAAALKLAGSERTVRHLFEIIRGGRIPRLDVRITGMGEEATGSGANVEIRGQLSRGRIVLPHDLLRLEQVDGRVAMKKGRLTAEDVSARLDNSFAQGGTLVLGLYDGSRDFSLDAAIDADLSELPEVLKKLVSHSQINSLLDRIPPVKGRAAGRLRVGDSLDQLNIQVSSTGRMEALDATMDVSGTLDVNPSAGPDCNLSLRGSLGPRMVAWLYALWGMPTDYLLKAPITVNQARITINRAEGWGMEGRFALPGGLEIVGGLLNGPDEKFSCNFHITDSASDADLDCRRTQANGWQAGFAGRLERSTVDKLLIKNAMILGWLRGDLRIRLRDGDPQHTTVQGRLDFRQIYTPPGFPMALRLMEGQVAGTGPGVDILSVDLEWQDSVAHLSGRATFTGETVNLELDLDVDTLDADDLTRRVHFAHRNKDSTQLAGRRRPEPLVSGTLRIRAGQVALKGYRIAPLRAVATLGDEYVSLDLIDAGLCGITIPGQIRFDPAGVWLLLKPQAAGAVLRNTDQCMAGTSITERLEGSVSVQGRIESRGQSDQELVHNLKGGLEVQITDGRVYNAGAAGFFTNLMAFISVNQLIDGVLPDLRQNDFRYKNLTSKLSFKEGMMRIEEGVLKSNAVNIVASGDYDLTDKEMNLVLLVSPLTTVDWVIERIPLIGNILQGTLVAVPVGVKGPAADPSVVPLSPRAVGSRLGGIFKRTLKTPYRILSPLLKDKPSKDQKDK